jgi:microcystin-dependent protein
VNTIGRVTAAGDLLYASAANALARLPIGSGTQLLTVVAGAPAWANLPANSIGASQLQTDSVGTGPIAPLAVTSAELAASSVTAGKIASGGTAYGVGDGSTTFNIPDYRGKVILGAGTGLAPNNTARSRGQVGGEETHVLTQAEMPTHNHTSPAHNHSGSTTTADASGLGAGAAAGGTAITFTDGTVTVASEAVTIQNAGSSAAHQNMPPFGVANVFIKT